MRSFIRLLAKSSLRSLQVPVTAPDQNNTNQDEESRFVLFFARDFFGMIALQTLRTVKKYDMKVADRFIDSLRNRSDRHGAIEYIDFTDYKALPMDPVNCFEQKQTDYTKYDELVSALQLSALEIAILNCYMNGMVQSEVCAELGIGRGRINSRKASIRRRYYSLYGAF